jgi:hypothetical protein
MSNLLAGYQSASEIAPYFTDSQISHHYLLSDLKSKSETFPYFLAGCGFTAKMCHSALRGEDPHAERLKDLIRSFLFMSKITKFDLKSEFDAFTLGLGLNHDVDITVHLELVRRYSEGIDLFNNELFFRFEQINSENKHQDFAAFLAGAGFQENDSKGTCHNELPLALKAFIRARQNIKGHIENFFTGYYWITNQVNSST